MQRSDEASAGFISHIRIQHSSQAKLRAFKKKLVSYQAKAAEWEQYERDYKTFFEQINHYNKHMKKLNLLFPPTSDDLILHLLNIKQLKTLPGIKELNEGYRLALARVRSLEGLSDLISKQNSLWRDKAAFDEQVSTLLTAVERSFINMCESFD